MTIIQVPNLKKLDRLHITIKLALYNINYWSTYKIYTFLLYIYIYIYNSYKTFNNNYIINLNLFYELQLLYV